MLPSTQPRRILKSACLQRLRLKSALEDLSIFIRIMSESCHCQSVSLIAQAHCLLPLIQKNEWFIDASIGIDFDGSQPSC